MARMLSQIATVIRGSVGGITYTANQFHAIIMRARVSPVQPNTTAQQLARLALSTAQGTWLTLTQVVRDAWETYSRNLFRSGPVGTYTVPGRQSFIAGRALQNYVNDRGLAVPNFDTSAPPVFGGFYLPERIVTALPPALQTGVAISYTSEALVDALVMVQIAGPFPETVRRYKGPWNTGQEQAQIVVMATSALISFDGLTVGDIFFMRVSSVADAASPRSAAPVILRMAAIVGV